MIANSNAIYHYFFFLKKTLESKQNTILKICQLGLIFATNVNEEEEEYFLKNNQNKLLATFKNSS